MDDLLNVSLIDDTEEEEEDSKKILERLRDERRKPSVQQPIQQEVPQSNTPRSTPQITPSTRKPISAPVRASTSPQLQQPSAPPKKVVSQPLPPPQTIYAANRQQNNPIMNDVRNVKVEFRGDIIPDFILNDTTCALYISVAYYLKKEDYLWRRIQALPQNVFALRLILCHIDTVCRKRLSQINI
jgi:DNA repair protein Rad10